MTKFNHIFNQFKANSSSLLLIAIISAIIIGATIVLHLLGNIPLADLTRDVAVICNSPPHTGFLSQVGIFFWSATVAICLFTEKIISSHSNQQLKKFFLVSGLFTLLLTVDDLFMLHEEILPSIGIRQKVVLLIYIISVLIYFFHFYKLLLHTEYILMAIALFFFGVSVIVDQFTPPNIDLRLLEDGAKFIGIVSWLSYFITVAQSSIKQMLIQGSD